MGFNISYLATRLSYAELAEEYRLELSPLDAEIPLSGKSWIAELSNGWTVWWAEEPDSFQLNKINPHIACKNGQHCYAVSIAEFCMHSSIAKYTPSSKRWSVAHYGDGQDPEHLKITGKPPKIFAEIRDAAFERQQNQTVAPVDKCAVPDELKAISKSIGGTIEPFESGTVDYVFDVPILLGRHFFGFSYDRVPEPGMVVRCHEVLGINSAKRSERSLLQRIFGC